MRSPHVQCARAHRWLHEAHAQTRIAWALTERCQMRVWRCWSTRLQHSLRRVGPCRFWCCRGTLSQDSVRRVGWPWRVWYRRHTLLNHLWCMARLPTNTCGSLRSLVSTTGDRRHAWSYLSTEGKLCKFTLQLSSKANSFQANRIK